MEKKFSLNINTKLVNETNIATVDYAVQCLKRDMEKTFMSGQGAETVIKLECETLDCESFHISFKDNSTMIIGAGDELGFIYGIFYISKEFLAVQPFWFWNSQVFKKKQEVMVEIGEIISKPPKIRFRGWFINDEVLIHNWSVEGSKEYPWVMAFEALLRCGGNMVIPGTDSNSKLYREKASQMGLYITHHHAEPIGAEMFARVYPQLTPSYAEHPELFQKLWKEGIQEQKHMKVIWNLGFRGQGDRPFWADSPQYDTSESRGKLISELIKLQLWYVSEVVENPICCINLYGEVMELYKEGHIDLPENVIRIWADNGYGKMVTRRMDLHNPRIPALPQDGDTENRHGIYYHVSFYDLQAANHMTMQPNSVEFIGRELQGAFTKGVRDYLIVNCSNIKPHVFYLDALRKLWSDGSLDAEQHLTEYITDYYGITEKSVIEDIRVCYKEYSASMVQTGEHEDEHAGDQFYNYTTRILAHYWLKGQVSGNAKELLWATGEKSFQEQVKWYLEKCIGGQERFASLFEKCTQVHNKLTGYAKVLFEESIFLQVKIHLHCLTGAVEFCNSYESFCNNELEEAFYLISKAIENYQKSDREMRQTEKDIWKGFYANDCLCDIKYTAEVLKHLRFYIRNMGDGPHFFQWQRKFLYKEEDRRVMLLTNMENHLTDEELYEAMDRKEIVSHE